MRKRNKRSSALLPGLFAALLQLKLCLMCSVDASISLARVMAAVFLRMQAHILHVLEFYAPKANCLSPLLLSTQPLPLALSLTSHRPAPTPYISTISSPQAPLPDFS